MKDIRMAARMCSIIASTPGFMVTWGWSSIDGVTGPIANIAWDAHYTATIGTELSAERWAAAEALLRTGWTP